jgi:hypothetical protein
MNQQQINSQQQSEMYTRENAVQFIMLPPRLTFHVLSLIALCLYEIEFHMVAQSIICTCLQPK